MLRNSQKIELLAPAGSMESLSAAIQAGADAVYFGVGELNMRAYSSKSFGLRDLKRVSEICRKNGVKTYLTLNTVIYDQEAVRMRKIVAAAQKAGISAVIASDQSVIAFARSISMPVHISTQVNISNMESVRFYSSFADVMVLARELNLEQVKKIHQTIRREKITGPSGNLVRLEMFIHGALCMSVSGKCYLSLHQHNHSANRGSCLQPCRRAYTVKERESGEQLDIENEYIMSPKDLCTIGFLDRIIQSGATVLKIEGRARAPEYVKTVVRCYREAIEAIENNRYSQEKINEWTRQLSSVFNRGFWNGYYLGQKLGEWNDVHGSKATSKKTYVARNTNYYAKISVAEFILESGSLRVGDQVLVIGPTTGVLDVQIREIRTDAGKVEKVKKGDVFAIPVNRAVRRSDKLYKVLPVDGKTGR
jgi:U32 family peptidase